ncbi:MAG: PDZ domain-containing protein [bacterium]|nr:PDZ domain-containing protein [bacterium]
MFELPAARRPLGLAVSLFSLVLAMAVTGPAAAADGYLGVMLQEVSPSMGKALQLGDRAGVLVNDVVDDGPAAKAGLQDGDIILALDGHPATSRSDLTKAVRGLIPGATAELVVLRDGRQVKLRVEIGERASAAKWHSLAGGDGVIELEGLEGLEDLGQLEGLKDFEWFEEGDTKVMVLPKGEGRAPRIYFEGDDENGGERRVVMRRQDEDRGWLGVHLDALNGQLGEYFGVKEGAGVLVKEVEKDSPAAKAGLRAGDVIVKAGDTEVAAPDALHKAMAGTKPGQDLELQVLRKGSREKVTATLGKMPQDRMPPEASAVRQFRFRGDDDQDAKMSAPRVLRRMGRDGSGEREIVIERKRLGDDDLDEVRQEMEALRKELKELREELKR